MNIKTIVCLILLFILIIMIRSSKFGEIKNDINYCLDRKGKGLNNKLYKEAFSNI
jgi:hypothetical protein